MNYVDKNRSRLQAQYSFASYLSQFEADNVMLGDLLEMFKKEDFEMIDRNTTEEELETVESSDASKPVETAKKKRRTSADLTADDRKQFEQSKALIQLQIKALIARDLWNTNEYFQVFNAENDALKKAVEIINNTAEYNKLLGK